MVGWMAGRCDDLIWCQGGVTWSWCPGECWEKGWSCCSTLATFNHTYSCVSCPKQGKGQGNTARPFVLHVIRCGSRVIPSSDVVVLRLMHVHANGSVFRAANGIRCKRQKRAEFAEVSQLGATKTRNELTSCCVTCSIYQLPLSARTREP